MHARTELIEQLAAALPSSINPADRLRRATEQVDEYLTIALRGAGVLIPRSFERTPTIPHA